MEFAIKYCALEESVDNNNNNNNNNDSDDDDLLIIDNASPTGNLKTRSRSNETIVSPKSLIQLSLKLDAHFYSE